MTLRFSPGLRNMLMGIHTNLVTNGDFTTDTDPTPNWTATTSALTTEGSGQSGNCMRVAESGGAAVGIAYQDIATEIGKRYWLSLYMKKGTADSGSFRVGTTADDDAIYQSPNYTDAAWTLHEFAFTATATTTRISMVTTDATAGEYTDFDTIVFEDMSHSCQDIFKNGWIDIYTGAQPATANLVPSGTLLVSIKKSGTDGVSFDDAVAGVLSKAAAETWQGTVSGAGTQTAGWFRLRDANDLGTTNDTDPRIDGAISTSGSQLNFTSTSFTNGAVETVTTFAFTLPAA